MSNQDYFTEGFQACESDIERLDQDGDVILAVEGQSPDTERHFLVSSKVLSLASPVFARLFAPGFLKERGWQIIIALKFLFMKMIQLQWAY